MLTAAKENGIAKAPGHSFLSILLKLWLKLNANIPFNVAPDAMASAFSAIIGAFTVTFLYGAAEQGKRYIFDRKFLSYITTVAPAIT